MIIALAAKQTGKLIEHFSFKRSAWIIQNATCFLEREDDPDLWCPIRSFLS